MTDYQDLKKRIGNGLKKAARVGGRIATSGLALIVALGLASCNKQETFNEQELRAKQAYGYHHIRTLEDGALVGGWGNTEYLLGEDFEPISENHGFKSIRVAPTDDLGIETGYASEDNTGETYLIPKLGDKGRLDFRELGNLENGARWGRVLGIYYILDNANNPISTDERYVAFDVNEKGVVCGESPEIVDGHVMHAWYALNENGERISEGYGFLDEVAVE